MAVKGPPSNQNTLPKEYWSDLADAQSLAKDWVAFFADWLGADKADLSIEEQWNATKPATVSGGFFDTFDKVREHRRCLFQNGVADV